MDKLAPVRRNINWFQNSGIMRPSDGFWGAGERIVLAAGNEALEKIDKAYYCQTRLHADVVVLEHRRADCNFETALMFDLAAEALQDAELKQVADNLLSYLVRRSGLRHVKEGDPTRDLWGWSNPLSSQDCWTDDNSWVVTLLSVLARRGRPELRAAGVAAGQALNRMLRPVVEHLWRHGKDVPLEKEPLPGSNLSPHWLGLVTMALAHASAADPATNYTDLIAAYYECAPSGPPRFEAHARPPTTTGLPWTLSEYGYLSLAASVVARQLGLPAARDAARLAADALVAHQQDTGHFPAEHPESPTATHLADFVYTQNWATLGLYHAWLLFDRHEAYRRALDRSLEFLARVQDASGAPWTDGSWRGLYDTQAGAWGGGDRWEGGAGSIYSGWTNAPIALAFLFDATGASLFAGERDAPAAARGRQT
jgi:hypothetical protein